VKLAKTLGAAATACLLIGPWGCNMPPKRWDPWDGGADGGDGDAQGDGDAEADADGDADADSAGDAEADADGDAEADADAVDLCAGVFCFPDETCDPATGECTSDGLDCGDIVACWMDGGMALTGIFPCLLEGSAEGRRDFTALVSCLVQSCLTELLGAAGDPMPLGICALESCPSELTPCAGGFF
jgi:hypothetical protein